jgi:diacylglycerol kinase family enzyme
LENASAAATAHNFKIRSQFLTEKQINKSMMIWIYPVAVGVIILPVVTSWWIERSKKKWKLSLVTFAKEHHRTLQVVSSSEEHILFIVNPAAGCGKAMKEYSACLDAFLLRKATVEVYVTKGAEDLRTLTTTKDLSKYTCIAFLSGDSTMSESIQETFRKHGKWPYAPILHLPGGSSNVIANELFPIGASCVDIIAQYSTSKKGCVLKATGCGKSIFALQIFGAGINYELISKLDSHRHGLYAVFGKLALMPIVVYTLFRSAKTCKNPALLSVMNSEHEAEGMNFQLGLNRLDSNMNVVCVSEFASGLQAFKFFMSMAGGQLGKGWQAGKKTPDNVEIQLTTKYTINKPVVLMTDGSLDISLKADSVEFEALPEAIAFWTPY